MKGTVIKRGASWSVVIDLGREETGRRVRKWHSGYRTKKDAERARIELLSRLDQGTYVPPSKVSIGAFLIQDSYRVAQKEERVLLGPDYANSDDLVFTKPNGSAIHPERFSAWFTQRCRKSGLPRVRLHDVRHSYVTALLAEGVP